MNRIKELRAEKGVSLQQVADMLGITRQAVQHYEIGRSEPKTKSWGKLAKFFNVRVGYVMGLEDER